MRKTLQISSLLSVLMLAGGVNAAGLGKLSVQSHLGQPLRAEIELLAVQKDELQSINAKLASMDAFRQARIDRTDTLGSLRFTVDQRANGQPIIRITSAGPVSDPFLDMLVELNWTSGRLLREYTILLDPPPDLRTKPMVPVQAPVAAPVASRPAAPVEPAPVQAPVAAPAPARYGPVRSGETLRGIAAKVRPGNVSVEQTMVGLFQNNQDAFMGDNMNRLKKGKTLSVPAADALRALSPARAARTVQNHAADWQAYRRQLAEQVAEQPAAPPAERPAEGRVAPKPEPKPAAPGPSQDVLKLSKGGTGAGPDAKTMEKLNALEEELAAKSRALNEAQQRVTQLENTVRDLQRLMELRAQEAAKPAAPPAPEAAPPAVEAPVLPPVAEMPAPAIEAEPEQAAPAPAAAPLPAPIATEETSWLRSFITNPIYIGGIIAAILLSVLLWMMMVGNRRKQGLTSFEDSIMTGGEFKHEAVFKTGGSSAAGTPTEGSMLLTDFSRLGLGSIDTHEVDPIAEAEVYMAYGRDAQAEEILKEALGKDPSRHEITLKLLEIYAARKDTVAFETQASELYAALGGQATQQWRKAAEMGREIDPDNPLYRVSDEAGMGMSGLAAVAAPVMAATVAKAASGSMRPEAMDDMGGHADNTLDGLGLDSLDEIRHIESTVEMRPEPVLAPAEPVVDNLIDFESSIAPPESMPAPETDSSWFEQPLESPTEAESEFMHEFTPSVRQAPEPQAAEAEAPVSQAPVARADSLSEAGDGLDWTTELQDTQELPAEDEQAEDLGDLYKELLSEPEPEQEAEAIEIVETPAEDIEAHGLRIPDELPELEPEPEIPEFSLDEAEDIELEEPVVPASAETSELPLPDLDLGGIDLEMNEPLVERAVEAAPPKIAMDPELWEEVNTKLDLARAYMEMGDKEGAREILQEVMNEGDDDQKGDAGKLMAECA